MPQIRPPDIGFTDDGYDERTADGQRMVGACVDYARSMGWDPDYALDSEDEAPDLETIIVEANLSGDDQDLLLARYVDGGSIADIADAYGVSGTTITSRLLEARRRLRDSVDCEATG